MTMKQYFSKVTYLPHVAAALVASFAHIPGLNSRGDVIPRLPPEPSHAPKLGGSFRRSMSLRRAEFIDAHNRNPLNFLPGRIVHGLYAGDHSQRSIEAQGHRELQRLISEGYRPKPGYTGDGR